jgi:hypothetical protein
VSVTVDASVAEIVTNLDFNCASVGMNVALTENDLNIEVICRASETVNVADALNTLFNVVMVRASVAVNVALTDNALYRVVILEINGVNVRFAESDRYVCLMSETVNVAGAESVFQYVGIRESAAVKVADAATVLYRVVSLPIETVDARDALNVRQYVGIRDNATVLARLAEMAR